MDKKYVARFQKCGDFDNLEDRFASVKDAEVWVARCIKRLQAELGNDVQYMYEILKTIQLKSCADYYG